MTLLTRATNLPQISAVTKHAPVTSHSTGGFPDPRTALVVCCLALGKGHKTKRTEPPARFPAAVLSAALQASGRKVSRAWVFLYKFRAQGIVPQEIKCSRLQLLTVLLRFCSHYFLPQSYHLAALGAKSSSCCTLRKTSFRP